VIWAHTKSPEALIEAREIIRLGRNLYCDRSVTGISPIRCRVG
jgi:hypothetical protein